MPPQDEDRELKALREAIDQVDTRLLALLNERAVHAHEIGTIKKRRNDPIFVPEREEAVLERMKGLNGGPLSETAIEAIFRSIFDQMKRLEAET